MKLLILGNGMMGGMAQRYFSSHGYEVTGMSRKDLDIKYSNTEEQIRVLTDKVRAADAVLNCIGAIKPKFACNDELPHNIYVNAVFPHLLANICEPLGKWMLQITSDCSFDGLRGQYMESMPHTATDDYGRSKSLGEPLNCLVIRTSIIGPEWGGNKRSLVEWLLSKNGGKVDGYMNHVWNGLTTLELCKMIDKILRDDLYQMDNFNLYSTDVNKFQLLSKMCAVWGLNIEVHPTLAAERCDRTLRTIKQWQWTLKPALLDDMLKELTPYVTTS
jgi:dTDP-4-dehydrorhamnose reductase